MKRLTIFSLALAFSHSPVVIWSATMENTVTQLNTNLKVYKTALSTSMYLVGFDWDILEKQCQMGTVYGTQGEKITLHGNGKATVENKGTYPLQVEKKRVMVYKKDIYPNKRCLWNQFRLKSKRKYEGTYMFVSKSKNKGYVLTHYVAFSFAKDTQFTIFVKTLKGRTIVLEAGAGTTIQEVKSKIQDQEGIPSCEQHLLFQNKELDNPLLLADYHIQKPNTLYLVRDLKGGGTMKVKATDFKNKKEQNTRFANKDAIKNGKAIEGGMNVQGICKNKVCRLYGKKVWVALGYSQNKNADDDDSLTIKYGIKWFDFGILCQQFKCIACKQLLHKAETIGFLICKYKVKGILSDRGSDINLPKIPNSANHHDKYWKADAWKKAYAYTQGNKLKKYLGGPNKSNQYSSLYIAVEKMSYDEFFQNSDQC